MLESLIAIQLNVKLLERRVGCGHDMQCIGVAHCVGRSFVVSDGRPPPQVTPLQPGGTQLNRPRRVSRCSKPAFALFSALVTAPDSRKDKVLAPRVTFLCDRALPGAGLKHRYHAVPRCNPARFDNLTINTKHNLATV